MMKSNRRVLVTGGGTFLGDNIAAALLADDAEVTLLVRPGAEDNLGPLAQRTRWYTADVWDAASLRGRARGHATVIHTVGSLIADPAQGLTYHRLNFVSTRNVANMCVGDGAPHMVLISSVYAPWVSRQYVRTKREAEQYVNRVGLKASIIRAPLVYIRGQSRPLFYQLMTLLGSVPPVSWLGFDRIAPMPVDVLARGVARIGLEPPKNAAIYYARDLRKRNTRREMRQPVMSIMPGYSTRSSQPNPFVYLDEDIPFGWTPDTRDRE
jgi:nucleoside-diphosphate-sugar epimerase